MEPACREMKAMQTWVGKRKMPRKAGIEGCRRTLCFHSICGFIHRCPTCLHKFENVLLIQNMLAALQKWQFSDLRSNLRRRAKASGQGLAGLLVSTC